MMRSKTRPRKDNCSGLCQSLKLIIVNKFHFPIALIITILFSPALFPADIDSPAESVNGIPQSEYAALYSLYRSTGGEDWTDNTNWLSGFHASLWYGITVENGHVIGVVLPANNLRGTIPPELGNLTSLRSLMLDSNKLTGAIPPELGNINSLLLLWLDGNSLSGDLPSFLAEPPEHLDLRYNQLYASNLDVLNEVEVAHSNDFRSTQTLSPGNLAAVSTVIEGKNENRVLLTWDPISYQDDEGGYQVFFKRTGDPEYLSYGMTGDKSASSFTVSDLEPGEEYDFKLKTVTWAHEYQKLIPS